MAKWLITGGCGFLGSNIADEVLSQGHEAVILDNLSRLGSSQNRDWLRERHGSSWRLVTDDIRDGEAVARLVREERPAYIAHLAGQVAMTTSLRDPRYDFEVNALGSLNVLEAVRNTGGESVVLYSSTNKVYGDLEWVTLSEGETRYEATQYPHGFDESIPLAFASPYGCSKGAADQYMQDYCKMYGVRTVTFRHSSMYGGRQFASYDQGWVGWFCREVLRQAGGDTRPLTVSGNGKQVRDLLHADDMRRLYVTAAAKADTVAGRVFNIGGGTAQSLSILELLARSGEAVGVRPLVEHLPARASDQRYFVADTRNIEAATGWSAQVDVAQGVERMLTWIKSETAPVS